MKYKVKKVEKYRTMPDKYGIFYKKWFWLFWVPMGVEGTNKSHLLQIAYEKTVKDMKK